jgi:hypothetical protein
LLAERLDVTTIVKNSAKMDVLSNSVFEDYQVKLMPRMKNKAAAQRMRVGNMSNEDAMSLLDGDNFKKEDTTKRIDDYIRQNLDRDFVNLVY